MGYSQIPMKTELGNFAGEMGIKFIEMGNSSEETGRRIRAGRVSGFRLKKTHLPTPNWMPPNSGAPQQDQFPAESSFRYTQGSASGGSPI